MDAISKLFGGGDRRDKAAEAAAKAQADAAHIEAQEARRRRITTEQEATAAGNVRSASMFLANRGTRYSGLKPSLGG